MVAKEEFAGIVEFSDSDLKTHVAAKFQGFDEDIIPAKMGMVTADKVDMRSGDANLDKTAEFVPAEQPFQLFCFRIRHISTKSYKARHFNGIHSISFGNGNSCSGNL